MRGSSFIELLRALFLLFTFLLGPVHAIKKPYIVYLGGHSHGPDPSPSDLEAATNSHYDLLSTVLGSREKAMEAIFYSYNKHINGFAATLEEEEATEIAKNPNVVSVFLNKVYKLHTTRSWEFLGLDKQGVLPAGSAWKRANYGANTIIANIDTGVWPESPSFSDRGIGPIPTKWRGVCQLDNFRCNRKLIGARFFAKGYEVLSGHRVNRTLQTARDFEGHGTHTLSTAGGNFVANANIRGLGNGTAKGGSPKAHVVAYKACWIEGGERTCLEADLMDAFDHAIHDGVDVISISVGDNLPIKEEMFTDGTSIGSFHAIIRNIVVVASGGNRGPRRQTVSNVAPWLFTVAASTMDRKITSNVSLGSNRTVQGASLNRGPADRSYPSIRGENARLRTASRVAAQYCRPGTLDPRLVRGKAVICSRGPTISSLAEGEEAVRAGARELLFVNDAITGNTLLSEPHGVTSAQITSVNGGTGSGTGGSTTTQGIPDILMSKAKTFVQARPAPAMAVFSSLGPNVVQPLILKPDIAAPGVDIIAAYSLAASQASPIPDIRGSPYYILQGTSQACPHIAGVAGLLKTVHPDWSPAAIKSAIMTTATVLDNTNNRIQDAYGKNATPLHYGAGHVQPNFAMDPGLVYDLGLFDYLNYLCVSNYGETVIRSFSSKPYKCPRSYDIANFNYPSITVRRSETNPVSVTRTLTNVGPAGTYFAKTDGDGIEISVNPRSLTFKKIGEKKRFRVTVKVSRPAKDILFGELVWTNGRQKVRSPVVALLPA